MSEKMTEEVTGALEDDLRDKKEVRVKDEDLKNTIKTHYYIKPSERCMFQVHWQLEREQQEKKKSLYICETKQPHHFQPLTPTRPQRLSFGSPETESFRCMHSDSCSHPNTGADTEVTSKWPNGNWS